MLMEPGGLFNAKITVNVFISAYMVINITMMNRR